jgi:hypothetical protein
VSSFYIKGRHRRDRLPLRPCHQQTSQRPFISARPFAISFLALGISSPSRSLVIHPPQSQRPSPCLLFVFPPLPARDTAGLGAPPSGMDHAGARREDPGRQNPPPRPSRGGIRPLQLVRHVRIGAADLLFLPPSPGGVRPSAPAPHPPLRPPRGGLRPLYGYVRGGPSLHRHLQALLRPGRAREEQARGRRLLLPASARDGRLLHQRLLQCQVGGLA